MSNGSDIAATSGLRVAGVPLSLSVMVAAGCAIVGAGIIARDAFPALSSIFAPSERTDDADPLQPFIESHQKLFETSEKRWEGRYVFFPPNAPKKPDPPKPKPEPVTEPKPIPIQPAPSTYGGTKPTGIFGDIVFFGADKRVPVGEKMGEVEVLAIEPPFNVKVGWTKSGHHRGEYTVSIWEYSPDLFSRPNPFPKTSLAGFKEVSDGDGASGAAGGATSPDEVGGPDGGRLGPPKSGDGSRSGRPGSKPGDGKSGPSKPGDPKSGDPKLHDPKNGDPKAEPTAPPPQDPNAPPANEGGPGEGGPQPETQPATQPNRRYPPGQAPKQSASEDSGQQMEPIPLDKLPPFRTEADIKAMSAQTAQSALQKINESLAQPNLDDHNRARLEYDAQLISQQLKATK
jgi:hypothetical protein